MCVPQVLTGVAKDPWRSTSFVAGVARASMAAELLTATICPVGLQASASAFGAYITCEGNA